MNNKQSEQYIGRFKAEESINVDNQTLWMLYDEWSVEVARVFTDGQRYIIDFYDQPEDDWTPQDLRDIADFLEKVNTKSRKCRLCGNTTQDQNLYQCSCGGVFSCDF
jgi:hypothetical protein